MKIKNGDDFMEYGQAQPWVGITDADGTIYSFISGRKGQVIGVDLQREQELLTQIGEMESVLENYYQKLVELGVIVPEKTPEQIAKEAAEEQLRIVQEQAEEQAKINQALLSAIQGLQAEITEIKSMPIPLSEANPKDLAKNQKRRASH